MTFVLWRKLLRDIRVPLLVVALLLFLFEIFWVKVVERLTTEIAPMLEILSVMQGRGGNFLMDLFFRGPGKIFQTILGGENIQFGNPQDMLAVGYMHPLVQTILCIWAVGRAAGAIAGEIDRGTMELLLAQPIRRSRIVLAHLGVDAVAIPTLCLAMWAGSLAGAALFSPFTIQDDVYNELGVAPPDPPKTMSVDATALAPGLLNVGALLFAISGGAMWLSARGRSRNRVIGLAILFVLLQFIINVFGQLWDGSAFLRPFSIFYYYQPQFVALNGAWTVDPGKVWGGAPLIRLNVIVVLATLGTLGYLMALRDFRRRDIPAPL
jgi:ABC-2 type transport system permease protein